MSTPRPTDPKEPGRRRDALIGGAVIAVLAVLFALTLRADRSASMPASVMALIDAALPRNDTGHLPILDQPCDGTRIQAAEDLPQPEFRGALYVLCRHGQHGAIGLRLDLTSTAPASTAYTLPGTILVGGPLATTQAVVLYRGPDDSLRWTTSHRRARELARNTTLRALVGVGPSPESTPKIVAGHAAWGPGQLEAEIAAGAWALLAEGD